MLLPALVTAIPGCHSPRLPGAGALCCLAATYQTLPQIFPTAPEPRAVNWQVLHTLTWVLSCLVVLAVVEETRVFQVPFEHQVMSFPSNLSGFCLFLGL